MREGVSNSIQTHAKRFENFQEAKMKISSDRQIDTLFKFKRKTVKNNNNGNNGKTIF